MVALIAVISAHITQSAEQTLQRFPIALLAGGLAAATLTLGGCQKAADANPADPYAGLSDAILAWRGDIDRSPDCAVKPADGGKACQTYEVGCKAVQPVGPGEKAVTAKLVAAMSWTAWNPKRGDYEPASGGAIFAKTDGKWVRQDLSGPVNLSTCATS